MIPMKKINRQQLEKLDKESLIEIILALTERIQKLEDQLAKTSRNSGKPPSSDGLKKPKTRSLRKKGERKSGGQQGHEGHTLQMVAEPTYVIPHQLHQCHDCGASLADVPVSRLEKRQVFDIPPVQVEVFEHQAEIKQCPCCGKEVKASFPDDVTQPVQYGNRLRAQISYLNNYQLLPWQRTCDLIEDFYQHRPAQGLISSSNQQLEQGIDLSLTEIWRQLQQASVVHFDESGVRVVGKLHWLHVASTPELTYYGVDPKRGKEGMDEVGILPEFKGRAIHDHWKSYFNYDQCQHGLCNVHHLRELNFIVEQYEQPWAAEMAQLLLDIKTEIEQLPADQFTLVTAALETYSQQYDKLIERGLKANPQPPQPAGKRGRKKQTPPKNLLDRLQKYKAETLAFMYDRQVPFDNNLAERDVRMIKVKQKVSGSFRTLTGAETFCAIRSYISTVRKHGHNVIHEIYNAFNGNPFIPLIFDG
jgi:transposase